MPEVQEVFQMATQKVKPDPGALERQHQDQRQHAVRRKASVFALVAALLLIAAGIGVSILSNDEPDVDVGSNGGTPSPEVPLLSGSLDPGTYAFGVLDPGFADSYRVTIEVPAGYRGIGGWATLNNGLAETGVSAWIMGEVYPDAEICTTFGAFQDPGPPAAKTSAARIAEDLSGQAGFQVSTPTDVTLSGYSGTYMERTWLQGGTDGGCDVARAWRSTGGDLRYLAHVGQSDLVWVLDVDGFALVIDGPVSEDATAQDRAEVVDMVESIRIEHV